MNWIENLSGDDNKPNAPALLAGGLVAVLVGFAITSLSFMLLFNRGLGDDGKTQVWLCVLGGVVMIFGGVLVGAGIVRQLALSGSTKP